MRSERDLRFTRWEKSCLEEVSILWIGKPFPMLLSMDLLEVNLIKGLMAKLPGYEHRTPEQMDHPEHGSVAKHSAECTVHLLGNRLPPSMLQASTLVTVSSPSVAVYDVPLISTKLISIQ
ncbi:hypothetical protein NMY22_g10638 [Coprinellus aureogranulatus]|nr:hypothetical protein NMY22_g10638 [Coprinellus aureogranulatus]